MKKTRIFGLLFSCMAVGAIAAAPVNFTTSFTQAGMEQEEKEQEEKKEGEEAEKFTTKEVMKIAHKDKLLKKVATGKASDEEKKKLVTLYTAMSKNAPEKGDKEDWDERNKELIAAAKAAMEGEEDASDRLMKASDCQACHDLHK